MASTAGDGKRHCVLYCWLRHACLRLRPNVHSRLTGKAGGSPTKPDSSIYGFLSRDNQLRDSLTVHWFWRDRIIHSDIMCQRFARAVLAACLLTVARARYCTPPSCSAPASSYAWYGGESSTGRYVAVGGVFAVHGTGSDPGHLGVIREAGVQNVEAFLWAVRTFKTRYPSASANFTIRAVAFDSFTNKNLILQQVLNLEHCQLAFGTPPVSPSHLLAFVGTDTGEQAAALATELASLRKTLVSPAASNAFLSDVTKYPYFLRTVPSDGEQAKALVAMLEFRGWRYVQVVLEEGDEVGEEFRSAANNAGICIVQTQVIPKVRTSQHLADIVNKMITKKETRVVVVLAGENTINELLLKAISTRGMFTWVGGNSWGNSKRAVEGAKNVAEGAVIVALRSDDDPNSAKFKFMDYFKARKPNTNAYNPWMTAFWEKRFACSVSGKAGTTLCRTDLQSLNSVQLATSVSYTIEAVDAILHGIARASKNACPSNDLLCSTFVNDADKWTAIHDKIRSSNFNVTTGETLDTRHVIYNFRAAHDNCANHCYKEVGSYSQPSADMKTGGIAFSKDIYTYDQEGKHTANDVVTICGSTPCWECGDVDATNSSFSPSASGSTTSLPTTPQSAGQLSDEDTAPVKLRKDTWAIVLLILCSLGLIVVVIFEVYLVSKIVGSPIPSHWRTMWLGQLLLFSLLLCYLVLFAFVVSPTVTSCVILRFGVGVCYAMCFSVLLVKLMIIMSSASIGYLKGIYQFLMFVFAWGVQIVIDVEWLILRDPGVHRIAGTDQWQCVQGFTPHVQSLVYVMFLMVVCTLTAIKAHGIITNHREGVFVGMAAGFSIPVWVAWLLIAYLKDDTAEPAMAFGLLTTATLVLFIMFLPKVRQLNSMGMEGIYAEDDMPDYAGSAILPPTLMHTPSMAPGSVVLGPPSFTGKTGPGSMVLVNGGVYTEPQTHTLQSLHFDGNPDALYLRHPGPQVNVNSAASVRSAPVGFSALSEPRYVNLTRSQDLNGRIRTKSQPQSDCNFDIYATTRSNRSRGTSGRGSRMSGTLRSAKSLQDLGAL
ncbi:putative metabotropic glutamate receptor mgl-1 [Lamellibrachia satsuma]|nr:putative metabotropic glutamate receptor mgl-1 [Lamellibrachia satsuma]